MCFQKYYLLIGAHAEGEIFGESRRTPAGINPGRRPSAEAIKIEHMGVFLNIGVIF